MDPIRRTLLTNSDRVIQRFRTISSALLRAEEQAVSGLAVHRPSDAPEKWRLIHAIQRGLTESARWQDNADRAEDLLLTADGALDGATNVMSRALELAVQMADETYADDERVAGAGLVAALRDELVALGNTSIGDRWLFAGDSWDEPAFDTAGAYLGSAATHTIAVGDGQGVESSLDGGAVFGAAFAALSDLEAALAANDSAGVSAAISALQLGHDTLLAARETVGTRQTKVDDLRAVASSLELTLNARLDAAVGIDEAEAYTHLAELQTTYQAALQVTAASSGARLFDFLV